MINQIFACQISSSHAKNLMRVIGTAVCDVKNFQLMENLLQNGELKEPVMGNRLFHLE
jgi:hypothetical protein